MLLSFPLLELKMQKLFKKVKAAVKQAKADLECGKHSGFKPCCIFCYVILDNVSRAHNFRFYHYRKLLNRVILNYRKKIDSYGYIPCLMCVWLTPVQVKKCEREDHKHRVTHADWDDLYGSYQEFADRNSTLYSDLRKIDQLFKTWRDPVRYKDHFFENRTSW